VPSDSPSMEPSDQPSQIPSNKPSRSPSNNPTSSINPSPIPTAAPFAPTFTPSTFPTNAPTHTCKDDEDYEFNRASDSTVAIMVDCTYMCRNNDPEKNEKRKDKWCTGEVLEKCCASCSAVARCS